MDLMQPILKQMIYPVYPIEWFLVGEFVGPAEKASAHVTVFHR